MVGGARIARTALQALLAAIPRDITVVMIEHDMDTALSFAERITLLHYGKVIVEGSRAEVVAHPRTRESTLARNFGMVDALALRVADDVVILNTGRIVYDGPAEDARNQSGLLHTRLGIY